MLFSQGSYPRELEILQDFPLQLLLSGLRDGE